MLIMKFSEGDELGYESKLWENTELLNLGCRSFSHLLASSNPGFRVEGPGLYVRGPHLEKLPSCFGTE